jgi:hypothetical protein
VSIQRQPFHRARIETLQHALRTAGTDERLARLLDVKPERLRCWFSGEERVPLEIFLDALDLIARGPYEPERDEKRRPVVSAIPPDGVAGLRRL